MNYILHRWDEDQVQMYCTDRSIGGHGSKSVIDHGGVQNEIVRQMRVYSSCERKELLDIDDALISSDSSTRKKEKEQEEKLGIQSRKPVDHSPVSIALGLRNSTLGKHHPGVTMHIEREAPLVPELLNGIRPPAGGRSVSPRSPRAVSRPSSESPITPPMPSLDKFTNKNDHGTKQRSRLEAHLDVSVPGVLIPNTAVRVMFDRTATEPGELSLLKGDVATLLELKDHGWCVLRTTAGLQGYFPGTCIEPACIDLRELPKLEVGRVQWEAAVGQERAGGERSTRKYSAQNENSEEGHDSDIYSTREKKLREERQREREFLLFSLQHPSDSSRRNDRCNRWYTMPAFSWIFKFVYMLAYKYVREFPCLCTLFACVWMHVCHSRKQLHLHQVLSSSVRIANEGD
jgi:hypothetical protein